MEARADQYPGKCQKITKCPAPEEEQKLEKDKSNWGSYRESAFALRWSLALGFQSTRVGRAAEPRLCVAFEFGRRTLGFQSTRVGRAAEPGLC